jgi:hypothetical protein
LIKEKPRVNDEENPGLFAGKGNQHATPNERYNRKAVGNDTHNQR